jgi:TatA/E family protein of Tat protein translocase
MTVGALEILLVLFFVLLIIGPRRVANLGRSLGRGVRDFKLELGRDKKAVGDQRSALNKNKVDGTDGDGR